jgi:hypothetical protein
MKMEGAREDRREESSKPRKGATAKMAGPSKGKPKYRPALWWATIPST